MLSPTSKSTSAAAYYAPPAFGGWVGEPGQRRARRRRGPSRPALRVFAAAGRGGRLGMMAGAALTLPGTRLVRGLLGTGTAPTRRDYEVEHTGLLGMPEQALHARAVRLWDAGQRAAAGCLLAPVWGLYLIRATLWAACMIVAMTVWGATGLLGALACGVMRSLHELALLPVRARGRHRGGGATGAGGISGAGDSTSSSATATTGAGLGIAGSGDSASSFATPRSVSSTGASYEKSGPGGARVSTPAAMARGAAGRPTPGATEAQLAAAALDMAARRPRRQARGNREVARVTTPACPLAAAAWASVDPLA